MVRFITTEGVTSDNKITRTWRLNDGHTIVCYLKRCLNVSFTFSDRLVSASSGLYQLLHLSLYYQGWEAWPHAHLNEKLKSINIC